eukprot:8771453-Prorocentrum_lima.AAC.1
MAPSAVHICGVCGTIPHVWECDRLRWRWGQVALGVLRGSRAVSEGARSRRRCRVRGTSPHGDRAGAGFGHPYSADTVSHEGWWVEQGRR